MKKNKTQMVSLNLKLRAAIFLAAGALTAQAQPYPAAVLADGPIAYWKLQETSGTVAFDSSAGGANTGSYTNGTLAQQGYAVGLAEQLNYTPPSDTNSSAGFGANYGYSAGSYVSGMTLDEATTGKAEFSVEAWVSGGSQSTGAGIVGKGWGGGGEEYFIDCGAASGAFRFFTRNASGTVADANSTFYPDGNWHYLVGVCNESNGYIYLYIDGQLAASSAASGGINSTTNLYMSIGSRQSAQNGAFNDQFNGVIGQVAVYPYALSAAQVENHYLAAGIPPTFTLDPPDSVSVNAGGTVVIPSLAVGTMPLYYQWYTNYVAMTGETNATFELSNVPAVLNGIYVYAIASNSYGASDSSGTSLTVNSGAPQFVTNVQPSELALYVGRPMTYSVAVTGNAPFYYQWEQNGAGIDGATNSSLTVDTLSGANTYSVNVSNTYNGGSVTPGGIATLVGLPIPTNPYPATIVAANPIAYWRLDESDNGMGNTGVIANDYAGGHDGTYNQVVLGVSGYSPDDPDTAAEFGTNAGFPVDSYMQENAGAIAGIPTISSYLQGSNVNLTVECWVNGPAGQNSSGSSIVALGNNGSDSFQINASAPGGKFGCYMREPNGSTFGSIYSTIGPDGNWHHLVAVLDETGAQASTFYVDGNLAGTVAAPSGSGLYSTTVGLTVGSDLTYQFNGTIDEVSIYTNALSYSQILAHYDAAPQPPVFTAEPPPAVMGYLGENGVTLSASVLGSTPLTNQWYSNSVPIVGQTNLFLTLNNLAAGANTYVLKVSNAYGSTNTSGTVVTVAAGSGPPSLLADVSPLTNWIYAAEPISYSVTVSGSMPLYYQWRFNGQSLAGATTSTLGIASLAASNSGSYYCVISNSIGTIESSTAVLTVVPTPDNPYSLTVLQDHPLSYWRLDETNGSTLGYDYVGGNNGVYSNTAGIVHTNGIFGTNYDGDPAAYFNSTTNYTRTDSSTSNYLGSTMTNFNFAQPSGANGEFSIEAWARGYPGVNQPSGGGIVAKGIGNGAEQFNIDAHSGWRFYCRNAAGSIGATAQGYSNYCGTEVSGNWQCDGNWHYLVGVCDEANENLLLYVDGTLIGYPVITNGVVPYLAVQYQTNHNPSTGTNGYNLAGSGIVAATNLENATNIKWDANSVSIGARNSGSGTTGITLAFLGAVDEVAMYNYPLTPLQVSNHYAVAEKMSVTLNVQLTNGQPLLSWPSTWLATQTLQSSTNLAGPWMPVAGATSPYLITNTSPATFYRLKLY